MIAIADEDELTKVLRISGQLFGDVGEAFEPGNMGHKSPDSIIFCLTSADGKWPVAGLQQEQFTAGFLQDFAQGLVTTPRQVISQFAKKSFATIFDLPHPVYFFIGPNPMVTTFTP